MISHKRANKFRFYPNEPQKILLSQHFGCVRVVYNTILKMRTDAWYNDSKNIGYHESSTLLTKLKKTEKFSYLNDVSCVPLQQVLRHQQTAFKNFFEKRSGYPKFKKRRNKQSAEFTRSAFKLVNNDIILGKGIGKLKVKWSRKISSMPSTITVTRDCSDRYFVSLLTEEKIPLLKKVDKSIGLDIGITHLAISSDGTKYTNPKSLEVNLDKLSFLQKRFSRKIKGSNNRDKARLKVARLHAKITDTRKDAIHKLTTQLIRENQTVYVESLDVRGMLKNGSKSLSRRVSDASFSELIRQLEYKAEWYGREVVKIDQHYPSSKRCNCCGHILSVLPLNVREWRCPECKTLHDRDINASINIKAAGQAVTACGLDVRPVRPSGSKRQSRLKQEPTNTLLA